MSVKYTVLQPESLDEISLAQYQKFLIASETIEGHFLNQKMISLFFLMCLSEALMIKKTSVDDLCTTINELFDEEQPLQKIFKIGNKEFGFIPNLEELTMGEFIDLDTYLGDWKEMHRAMAVLYRPVTNKYKDTYEIEQYESSDKYAEVMKYAGMGAVMGAVGFFWNLSNELIRASQASLQEELTQEIIQQLRSLQEDGDGTLASMHSQVEDLIKLTLPQDTTLESV